MQDTVIESINGSVQSFGIKTTVEDWLVLGSKQYETTPDKVRAMSYAATQAAGWSDTALVNAVNRKYPHLDADMIMFVLADLKELVNKYDIKITGEVKVPAVSVTKR